VQLDPLAIQFLLDVKFPRLVMIVRPKMNKKGTQGSDRVVLFHLCDDVVKTLCITVAKHRAKCHEQFDGSILNIIKPLVSGMVGKDGILSPL
jgi:hypothetical protein